MLVRFTFNNFLSFKEEASLDMLATSERQLSSHVMESPSDKDLPLLRAAAIYGANASGKSNLVRAVSFAENLILHGREPDEDIHASHFRLNYKKPSDKSKFEFTVRVDDVVYTYGFIISSSTVLEEWLFKQPLKARKQEVPLFERATDSRKGDIKVEFGASLTGQRAKRKQFFEFIAEGTRPNQLLLTECYQRNVEALLPLIKWFKDILQVIPADARYGGLIHRASSESAFTDFLGKFLRGAGTGIEGVTTERASLNVDKVLKELSEEDKNTLLDSAADADKGVVLSKGGRSFGLEVEDKEASLIEIKTTHRADDGTDIPFEFHEESDGTQRLMHLIPMLYELKNQERVYLIDELDRRLHPLLSRLILKSYFDENVDYSDGQFIFTTHEPNLLDQKILRRDEIWFIEKDEHGASHLYSLADFDIRNDIDVEKGYLQGRFGAIPFLGDIYRLGLVNQ